MADATQMQVGRGRSAIALLLATCVLLSGVFLLRHETAVAHVRGALTGDLQHAHELAEFHELSTTPHLHGRNVDAHGEGACALLAALDHATIVPAAPAGATAPQPATIFAVEIRPFDAPPRALYRLAPKTSPPATI